MTNQLFIPTVAEYADDIQTSLEIQQPLVERGYTPGLMLVIKGGRKGITLDATVQKQYANLKQIQSYLGTIVTMLSNIPLEEIDFLHNPEYSAEHVKRGVDFSRGLPIGERKLLTFHLNSLVTSDEYSGKNRTAWRNKFHGTIRPVLQEIAEYSKDNGVEIKVETVPVPEFGDIPSADERKYQGVKWNEIRNPFYLTGQWGFEQIYDAGLGICLDLCHNRTIYEIVKEGDSDAILHEEDREELLQRELFDDVRSLHETDLAHVNDGDGIYSKQNQTIHREGVALGYGDIGDLREMINHLNNRKISYVLEINETDFKNRLNTKTSIEYLIVNY